MTASGSRRSTLDALLRAAAEAHPDAAMSPERLRFAELDALANHHASRWREALAPLGAGAALVIAPTAQSFAAIVGALRAGLALSLAPPETEARDLDAAIVAANASILAGPAQFAGISILDLMCEVAADQERIVLVGSHGGKTSGVLALDGARESVAIYSTRSAFASIRFVPDEDAFAGFGEDELVDAAASIARLAGIAPGDAILTTLSCASAAGLAAGPLAALDAGARLVFHAPFDARGFLAALEAAAPAHLVIPEALAPALLAAGALTKGRISSLILSCAEGSAEPAFAGASGGPPAVFVSAPAWGGVRVEAAPALGGAKDVEGGRAA